MELSEFKQYVNMIRSYPFKEQELKILDSQIKNAEDEIKDYNEKLINVQIEYNNIKDKISSSLLARIFGRYDKKFSQKTQELDNLHQQIEINKYQLEEFNLRKKELISILDYILGFKNQFEAIIKIKNDELNGDIDNPLFPRFIEIDTELEKNNILLNDLNNILSIINNNLEILSPIYLKTSKYETTQIYEGDYRSLVKFDSLFINLDENLLKAVELIKNNKLTDSIAIYLFRMTFSKDLHYYSLQEMINFRKKLNYHLKILREASHITEEKIKEVSDKVLVLTQNKEDVIIAAYS